ncbi:uncharacterized protein [Palaemon carinicauda]|uniref:uncharacterized protein n=1 Tax=Palaemon carinicauda TaxID=392227 RepID=UPI0035B58DE3
MRHTIGLVIVMCVLGTSQSAHHNYYFRSTNNEILTALTWAALDGSQDYWITSAKDLNKTQVTYGDNRKLNYVTKGNDTSIRPAPRARKTRSISSIFNKDISIDITLKTVIPLFQVYDSTFLRLEMPLSYSIPLKFLNQKRETVKRANTESRSNQMMEDIEDFVSMLGVDGKACIKRFVCEMAASPSLNLRGFVGEVVHIIIRRISEDSFNEDMDNEINDSEKPFPSNGEYVKAGERGKKHGDCWSVYPECPISIFNLVNSS